MSDLWTPGGERSAAGNNIGAAFKVDLPGIDSATQQVSALSGALDSLKKALRDLGSNGSTIAAGINTMLNSIARTATSTTQTLTSLASAVGGVGGGGGTNAGPAAPTGAGGGNWTSAATGSASAAVAAAGGTGGASSVPGGIDLTGLMGTGTGSDLAKSMAMFPLRFMRDTVNTNRQTALTTSAAMSMQSFATGAPTADIMKALATFPGSVKGTVADQLALFGAAPGYGAMYNFGAPGQSAPRAGGYFRGIQEAQMLSPGTPVADIASTIGGYASNTRAQQTSQMMTGGAFGMIKPGGGQKSLSEWAESVLRWLEGLRSGASANTGFKYGELIAQYFPGSNIDAWFDANGVPQAMRDYWWTYALGKTKGEGTSTTDKDFKITTEKASVAQGRLNATTSLTQTQFGLAGTMSGAYANKEAANKWMNDLMGAFQQQVVPSALSKGPLNFMQFMPDTMEQLLMNLLERSGTFGSAIGGIVGYGGGTGGILGMLNGPAVYSGAGGAQGALGAFADSVTGGLASGASGLWDLFNSGDIGDAYTTTGGKGTAGLHPSMQRKLGAMLQANPRLRVSSGLRDNAMQQRLKRRGVGRVSGKPSAHTRGMAADLGPASEYPWIVNNASKFGLSSGATQGEPWHVGMGDIGDAGDSIGGILNGLFNLFKGMGSDQSIEGVGGLASNFLSLLSGLMASGSTDQAALMFKPDLYSQLYAATKQAVVPVKRWGAPNYGVTPGLVGTPGQMTQTPGGYGGGRTALYGQYVTPSDQISAFQSTDEMTRGAAVAKALYAAGFRGQDLKNFTSISYRESHWSSPWVVDSDDVGGGLVGLNQLPWLKKGLTPPYSKEDILDPYGSAAIAYAMFNGTVPGQGKKGYAPWTMPGGTWQTNVPFDKGAAAVSQAGLGDIGDYGAYGAQMSGAPTLHQINFHNSFTVSGGGSGAGAIDLRRTVSTIADHLETEMKQRLARTS